MTGGIPGKVHISQATKDCLVNSYKVTIPIQISMQIRIQAKKNTDYLTRIWILGLIKKCPFTYRYQI